MGYSRDETLCFYTQQLMLLEMFEMNLVSYIRTHEAANIIFSKLT